VPPLCRALSDESYLVRMAVALALRKLQRGGAQCLEERLAVETNASVRKAIETSLVALDDPAPVIDASTRFYLAVDYARHETGRANVPALVRKRMRQTARGLGGIAFARSDESPEQASTRLASHKGLRAFFLSPNLGVTYADQRLAVRLRVSVQSYPERNLLLEFSRSATMLGVASPDPGTEDDLIAAVAQSAMEKFSTVMPNL
jgi:hypothetical protein